MGGFTRSHVCQLMLAVGWDFSWDVSQNTHVWPLHVTWATSKHGSLGVVGLPTFCLKAPKACVPANNAEATLPFMT